MGIFGKPEAKPPAPAAPKPATATPPAAAPASPSPAPPPAAAAAPGTARPSVIGPKAKIKGELAGDDDVVVEGTVEGQIHISRELRVAPGGRVLASVQAASIVVSGELVGNCTATQRIELQATAKLTGDLQAPRISIAEGATFKGKTEMGRVEAARPGPPPAPAPVVTAS